MSAEPVAQKCTKCGKRKRIADDFYRRPSGKPFVMCKECVREQQREYQARKREEAAAAGDGA